MKNIDTTTATKSDVLNHAIELGLENTWKNRRLSKEALIKYIESVSKVEENREKARDLDKAEEKAEEVIVEEITPEEKEVNDNAELLASGEQLVMVEFHDCPDAFAKSISEVGTSSLMDEGENYQVIGIEVGDEPEDGEAFDIEMSTEDGQIIAYEDRSMEAAPERVKRGPGRPKGSKNRNPSEPKPLTEKDIRIENALNFLRKANEPVRPFVVAEHLQITGTYAAQAAVATLNALVKRGMARQIEVGGHAFYEAN